MIHTLGLSPSLDVVYVLDAVRTGAIHRPRQVVRLAGGKSLNVSRALVRLGSQVRAVAPLAGPLGDLVDDSKAWERGVDELAAEDEDVADYVRALEETRDTADLPEASGEAIAREFERYLKRRDTD